MKRVFFGEEYQESVDFDRLVTACDRVENLMLDGEWRTLEEIADATGTPHASASAHLRALSHPKTGTYARERRPRGDRSKGLFEYRLVRRPADFMLTREELRADIMGKLSYHAARIRELSARLAELEVEQ